MISDKMDAWYFLPVSVTVLFVAIAFYLWLGDKSISDENQLMENSQVVFLALAGGFHLKQRLRISLSSFRIYHSILAMFCFSVMAREIDINMIGTAQIWGTIEIAVRFCIVVTWLLLAYYAVRRLPELWVNRFSIVFSPNSLLTVFAIAFYLASWFFDKQVVPINEGLSQFIEEALQLSGTIFFFTSSLKPISLSN